MASSPRPRNAGAGRFRRRRSLPLSRRRHARPMFGIRTSGDSSKRSSKPIPLDASESPSPSKILPTFSRNLFSTAIPFCGSPDHPSFPLQRPACSSHHIVAGRTRLGSTISRFRAKCRFTIGTFQFRALRASHSPESCQDVNARERCRMVPRPSARLSPPTAMFGFRTSLARSVFRQNRRVAVGQSRFRQKIARVSFTLREFMV